MACSVQPPDFGFLVSQTQLMTLGYLLDLGLLPVALDSFNHHNHHSAKGRATATEGVYIVSARAATRSSSGSWRSPGKAFRAAQEHKDWLPL